MHHSASHSPAHVRPVQRLQPGALDSAAHKKLTEHGVTLCTLPPATNPPRGTQQVPAKKSNWVVRKLATVKSGLKKVLQSSSQHISKHISLESLFLQLSADVCPALQFAAFKIGQCIQQIDTSAHGAKAKLLEAEYSEKPVSVRILDKNNSSIMAAEVVSEIRYLSCSVHPNILSVVGVSLSKKSAQLVFAYGRIKCSLQDYVAIKQAQIDGWQVPAKQAQSWAIGMGEAVSFLHSARVPLVHCGLRPSGVYLDDNLQIKVGDFSYCHYPGEVMKLEEFPPEQAECPYAAPELRKDNSTVEYKSDVYSFAMMLYFIGKGKDPYAQVFLKPDTHSLRRRYPAAFVKCIKMGWLPKTKARPTMAKMLSMLKGEQKQRRLETIPEEGEMEPFSRLGSSRFLLELRR